MGSIGSLKDQELAGNSGEEDSRYRSLRQGLSRRPGESGGRHRDLTAAWHVGIIMSKGDDV